MNMDLVGEMKAAAVAAVCTTDGTTIHSWRAGLRAILNRAMKAAVELGKEYREQIEQAAKDSVDALVALDIPGIPAPIEAWVDETCRVAAYEAVERLLDALLDPAAAA